MRRLGGALDNIVTLDGPDADNFIDAGNGYDVSLALRNPFTLGGGESTVYFTTTVFGTLPPEALTIPEPGTISGVKFDDLNANGARWA